MGDDASLVTVRADRVSGTEYCLHWTSHVDSGGGKFDRENVFEGVQRIELLEQQPLVARRLRVLLLDRWLLENRPELNCCICGKAKTESVSPNPWPDTAADPRAECCRLALRFPRRGTGARTAVQRR